MLTTETLSALKRAGFPLARVQDIFEKLNILIDESRFPELFPNSYQIAGHWYLLPSIEQLLIALGDQFRLLERTGKDPVTWSAMNRVKVGRGGTPLEALANLFLEVQK
jgi:hypothetical protein